jgi:hypothetical protein
MLLLEPTPSLLLQSMTSDKLPKELFLFQLFKVHQPQVLTTAHSEDNSAISSVEPTPLCSEVQEVLWSQLAVVAHHQVDHPQEEHQEQDHPQEEHQAQVHQPVEPQDQDHPQVEPQDQDHQQEEHQAQVHQPVDHPQAEPQDQDHQLAEPQTDSPTSSALSVQPPMPQSHHTLEEDTQLPISQLTQILTHSTQLQSPLVLNKPQELIPAETTLPPMMFN